MKIVIDSLTFNTQKAATEHFKEILRTHDDGQRIPEPHHTQLRALLDRHTEAAKKIGCGVDYFIIRRNPAGTRGFWVVRTDGTMIDFSYPHCIRGRDGSHREEVRKALRHEISEEIIAMKNRYFRIHGDSQGRVPCAIGGCPITLDDADADHFPTPFVRIADGFIAEKGINPPATDWLDWPQDAATPPRLKDRKLADEWRRFHWEIARIRIVDRRLHGKRLP
jgi:hypothetical protein